MKRHDVINIRVIKVTIIAQNIQFISTKMVMKLDIPMLILGNFIVNISLTQYYFDESELTYVKSGDIDDLYEKIVYAYNNRDLTKTKAEKAFQSFQPIRLSIMAKRYLDFLNSLN